MVTLDEERVDPSLNLDIPEADFPGVVRLDFRQVVEHEPPMLLPRPVWVHGDLDTNHAQVWSIGAKAPPACPTRGASVSEPWENGVRDNSVLRKLLGLCVS